MSLSWNAAVWLTLSLFFCEVAFGVERDSEPPIFPGEKLTYRLSWGVFNVGTVVMEVGDIVELGGKPAYKFIFSVSTNSFADAFYRVRDQFTSFADLSLSYSLLFRKRQVHRKRTRVAEVTFDWEKNHALYSIDGKKRTTIALPGKALDPLSGIFAARTLGLAAGRSFSLLLTDGKSHGYADLEVVAGPVLDLKAGKFETLLVRPNLSRVSEVFRKKGRAFLKVWVSNDKYRIPVRMVGKVKWGKFRADLLSIERGGRLK